MRLEVIYIMAHVIITLAIFGLYGVTLYNGSPDTTLQNGILIILGYWFGAMGIGKMKKSDNEK